MQPYSSHSELKQNCTDRRVQVLLREGSLRSNLKQVWIIQNTKKTSTGWICVDFLGNSWYPRCSESCPCALGLDWREWYHIDSKSYQVMTLPTTASSCAIVFPHKAYSLHLHQIRYAVRLPELKLKINSHVVKDWWIGGPLWHLACFERRYMSSRFSQMCVFDFFDVLR